MRVCRLLGARHLQKRKVGHPAKSLHTQRISHATIIRVLGLSSERWQSRLEVSSLVLRTTKNVSRSNLGL